jgi:hypothetical protein
VNASLRGIKLLLIDKRRPVLLESGASPTLRATYLFVWDHEISRGVWTAWKLDVPRIPDEWLKFSNLDTVIDPAHFPATTDPQPSNLLESNGHIFIAVSLDDRHLGGTHKTSSSTSTIELILGPWKFPELSIAWPHMLYLVNPPKAAYEAKRKLVEERFHQFGGLPRYLLTTRRPETAQTR